MKPAGAKPAPAKEAHEDYLTPANQTLLVQALEKNQFVGFKKMEPSLIHLDTPEQVQLAYAEAASAVDFINQSKGKAGVRELLATLKDRPTPEAVEKVYGMAFDAFETKWKAFLKAKGLKPIEGTRVRRLRAKKTSAKMKKWSSCARFNRRSRATARISPTRCSPRAARRRLSANTSAPCKRARSRR